MAESTNVGSVTGIWRFPVKSMKGERLEQGEFTERGLLGPHEVELEHDGGDDHGPDGSEQRHGHREGEFGQQNLGQPCG